MKILRISAIACATLIISGCIEKEPVNITISDPDHNLTIEIIAKNLQGKALPNIEFNALSLSCTAIPVTDDDNGNIIGIEEPTSPKSWCGVKALNLPIKTDADGKAYAVFSLDPGPNTVSLLQDEELGGPLPYQIPMIHAITEEETTAKMFVRSNEYWIYEAYFNAD